MTMETTLTTIDGTADGTITLPAVFETPLREDLIRRAVVSTDAAQKQPSGADPLAGMRTPAESLGSGRGLAHVPRQDGRGRRVPQAVSGRRAHPPKAQKQLTKKINRKERQLAVRAALAATADADVVAARGHQFDPELQLPIVVEDAFEQLHRTAEVAELFEQIGIAADVERADANRSVRAGRGTMRGRRYQTPKSVLVVTAEAPSRGARNLAGVDVVTAASVGTADLAPGGHPGRLTVYTEAAVAEVADR
jgi:large subunit ribosomal protein L4e